MHRLVANAVYILGTVSAVDIIENRKTRALFEGFAFAGVGVSGECITQYF